MSNTETIVMDVSCGIGLDGDDPFDTTPLKEALKKPLGKGKPGDRYSLAFLDVGDMQYWFGCFVITSRNRLLFFPPCPALLENSLMEKDSKKERLKDFKLDHLTFDFRTKDIHLTSCGGDHNRVFKRATKTDDETYFWFGLSCLNNNVLQPVYKGGRISFEAPAGDIDRRIIDWENSRDGQVFNLVRFHELSEKTLPSFMHFEVSVKLNNDEDSAPALIGMPYNNESRFWSCKYRDLTESPLPTRTHFVQFEGFCVCITAYMVNGLLHDNYTFSFAS